MTSQAQSFQEALRLHRLGQLAEAEQLYQQVLRVDPICAAAYHNLGLLHVARRDLAAAQWHCERAVLLDPRFAEAFETLGRVLEEQGKLNEAVTAYRAALNCRPQNVVVLDHLSSALVTLERFAEASALLEQSRGAWLESPECHYHLGSAYQALGRLVEAAGCFERAVQLKPEFVAPRCKLALMLHERGDLQAASAHYQEALRLKPEYVDVLNNYANLLGELGQTDQALELYNRAVSLQPDFALAHVNRANLYRGKGMFEQAVAGCQEALRLQPNDPVAYNNLAVSYNDLTEYDKAIECCAKALALPEDVASARAIQRRRFRPGAQAGADFALIHGTMAAALLAQGRADEAIDAYRRSIELEHDPAQHSNLLYALNFAADRDPESVFNEHLAWARQYAEPLTVARRAHANDRAPTRRLRVGYSSPYFRHHAVNFFVQPLLEAHDREQLEVFCYSDVKRPDATTTRLQAAADHWRDVRRLSDEQFAQLVRDDRIDIFVDLTGHIGENRLLVFARKPAPIQVTYIGYQNTTGMSAMDYRLTDERADPPDLTERFYTEQLVRLPRSFFCYRPSDDAPSVTPLPALAAGHVTFGSFNNFAKVTPRAIAAWLDILARVPAARLVVLANPGGYVERNFQKRARLRGIDPSRIDVCKKRPRPEYLRLIQTVDVALDPFPFNGHTTTCDALWQGVPVVMLEGDTYASRFGGSVLANTGQESLIARSAEQYVDLAVALACDTTRLAQLRNELRPRMASSPLLDFPGFARNVERAFRQMWINWCQSH